MDVPSVLLTGCRVFEFPPVGMIFFGRLHGQVLGQQRPASKSCSKPTHKALNIGVSKDMIAVNKVTS